MTMCTCSAKDFPGNAHCTVCCLSFSGETAFREHLVTHRGVVRYHLPPAEAGLEQKKSGVWGLPAGDKWWEAA